VTTRPDPFHRRRAAVVCTGGNASEAEVAELAHRR
jgi:hypothetical protein